MKKKPREKAEENHGPTPETARKLTPDPLLALYNSNLINGTHLRCAHEISTAFALLTLPVSLRLSNVEREGTADPVGQHDRWVDLIDRKARLFKNYSAWRKELKKQRLRVAIVEAIVVERISCRAATKRFGLRNGSVGGVVKSALTIYAKVAGYA